MPHTASAFNSDNSWSKQLFESSPDPSWIIEGSRFVECNEAAIRTLGYASREEFLNVHPSRLSPARQPDGEASFAKAERMMAIARDKGLHRFEWIHTKADGSNFVAEVTLSLINLEGRSVIYCVWRDISGRKQVEASILQERDFTHAALESLPGLFYLFDDQGRFLRWNRNFEQVSGYCTAEISAMTPEDFFEEAEKGKISSAIEQVFEQGEAFVEAEFVAKDRTPTPYLFTGKRFLFEQKLCVMGMGIDISARKQIEEALRTAKFEAEKANLAKSRFLAAASHDLRQPLSALSLFFDVLKPNIPSDCNELVVNIQDCVGSLTGLLTDLLDISKLDAGVVTVKKADIALDDLLGKLVSVHSAEARLKGLQLRVHCSGMVVHTDPLLLRRIVGNLIANAIRFTFKGGVLIACRRHQGRLWIEVWDTGIGIPEDMTDVIFEEFRQLGDEARNRGSGLGLAIVAKMARLLGLGIRVNSRPGHGSMFALELPSEMGMTADMSSLTTLPKVRFLRIGLVEDHPDVLKALTLVLKSLGHEVVAALSGRQLMNSLGAAAPDMVISDYRLADGETGFDVITATRDIYGDDLPAFLITGDTDPAVVRSMADRGIAVLFKPLKIAALQAGISEAIARK